MLPNYFYPGIIQNAGAVPTAPIPFNTKMFAENFQRPVVYAKAKPKPKKPVQRKIVELSPPRRQENFIGGFSQVPSMRVPPIPPQLPMPLFETQNLRPNPSPPFQQNFLPYAGIQQPTQFNFKPLGSQNQTNIVKPQNTFPSFPQIPSLSSSAYQRPQYSTKLQNPSPSLPTRTKRRGNYAHKDQTKNLRSPEILDEIYSFILSNKKEEQEKPHQQFELQFSNEISLRSRSHLFSPAEESAVQSLSRSLVSLSYLTISDGFKKLPESAQEQFLHLLQQFRKLATTVGHPLFRYLRNDPSQLLRHPPTLTTPIFSSALSFALSYSIPPTPPPAPVKSQPQASAGESSESLAMPLPKRTTRRPSSDPLKQKHFYWTRILFYALNWDVFVPFLRPVDRNLEGALLLRMCHRAGLDHGAVMEAVKELIEKKKKGVRIDLNEVHIPGVPEQQWLMLKAEEKKRLEDRREEMRKELLQKKESEMQDLLKASDNSVTQSNEETKDEENEMDIPTSTATSGPNSHSTTEIAQTDVKTEATSSVESNKATNEGHPPQSVPVPTVHPSELSITTSPSPPFLTAPLRPYQREGVCWLLKQHDNGSGGILGDEMGLGKTVQVCAFLAALKNERGEGGPHLIVSPLSVLPTWQAELARWTPSLKVQQLHGPNVEREKQMRTFQRDPTIDVVITTYDMMLSCEGWLQHQMWSYIILDECQRIKSERTLVGQAIRRLRSMRRLLLIGTPLQNNMHELWAFLNFLYPEVLVSAHVFDHGLDAYDQSSSASSSFSSSSNSNVIDLSLMRAAHLLLKRVMLRRLKSQVLNLPPKAEVKVYVPLSRMQVHFYKRLLEMNAGLLSLAVKEREKEEEEREKEQKRESEREMKFQEEEEREDETSTPSEPPISPSDSPDPFESLSPSPSAPSSPSVRSASPSPTPTPSPSPSPPLKTSLSNLLIALRKCCNHPYLFLSNDQMNISQDGTLRDGNETKLPSKEGRSKSRAQKEVNSLKNDGFREDKQQENENEEEVDWSVEALIRSSGKLRVLDELLTKMKEENDRIESQTEGEVLFGGKDLFKWKERGERKWEREQRKLRLKREKEERKEMEKEEKRLRLEIEDQKKKEKEEQRLREGRGRGRGRRRGQGRGRQTGSSFATTRKMNLRNDETEFLADEMEFGKLKDEGDELLLRAANDSIENSIDEKAVDEGNELKIDLSKETIESSKVETGILSGQSDIKDDKQTVSSSVTSTSAEQKSSSEPERIHKVLIYSQFTQTLDILEEYCSQRGFQYLRLDGSTSLARRVFDIAKFNRNDVHYKAPSNSSADEAKSDSQQKDADAASFSNQSSQKSHTLNQFTDPYLQLQQSPWIFLISTRAGGLGLNLQAADVVILYDTDWNPTVDKQAQDRAHRLGQTRSVKVFRLICRNTCEERVVQMAERKQVMGALVLRDDGREWKGRKKKGKKGAGDEEWSAAGEGEDGDEDPTLNDLDQMTSSDLSEIVAFGAKSVIVDDTTGVDVEVPQWVIDGIAESALETARKIISEEEEKQRRKKEGSQRLEQGERQSTKQMEAKDEPAKEEDKDLLNVQRENEGATMALTNYSASTKSSSPVLVAPSPQRALADTNEDISPADTSSSTSSGMLTPTLSPSPSPLFSEQPASASPDAALFSLKEVEKSSHCEAANESSHHSSGSSEFMATSSSDDAQTLLSLIQSSSSASSSASSSTLPFSANVSLSLSPSSVSADGHAEEAKIAGSSVVTVDPFDFHTFLGKRYKTGNSDFFTMEVMQHLQQEALEEKKIEMEMTKQKEEEKKKREQKKKEKGKSNKSQKDKASGSRRNVRAVKGKRRMVDSSSSEGDADDDEDNSDEEDEEGEEEDESANSSEASSNRKGKKAKKGSTKNKKKVEKKQKQKKGNDSSNENENENESDAVEEGLEGSEGDGEEDGEDEDYSLAAASEMVEEDRKKRERAIWREKRARMQRKNKSMVISVVVEGVGRVQVSRWAVEEERREKEIEEMRRRERLEKEMKRKKVKHVGYCVFCQRGLEEDSPVTERKERKEREGREKKERADMAREEKNQRERERKKQEEEIKRREKEKERELEREKEKERRIQESQNRASEEQKTKDELSESDDSPFFDEDKECNDETKGDAAQMDSDPFEEVSENESEDDLFSPPSPAPSRSASGSRARSSLSVPVVSTRSLRSSTVSTRPTKEAQLATQLIEGMKNQLELLCNMMKEEEDRKEKEKREKREKEGEASAETHQLEKAGNEEANQSNNSECKANEENESVNPEANADACVSSLSSAAAPSKESDNKTEAQTLQTTATDFAPTSPSHTNTSSEPLPGSVKTPFTTNNSTASCAKPGVPMNKHRPQLRKPIVHTKKSIPGVYKGRHSISCHQCPSAMHTDCYMEAAARLPTRFICLHHRCCVCDRSGAEAEGLLLRCLFCPYSWCHECVEEGFVPIEGYSALERFGYKTPKTYSFICCSSCLEKSDEERGWPEGEREETEDESDDEGDGEEDDDIEAVEGMKEGEKGAEMEATDIFKTKNRNEKSKANMERKNKRGAPARTERKRTSESREEETIESGAGEEEGGCFKTRHTEKTCYHKSKQKPKTAADKSGGKGSRNKKGGKGEVKEEDEKDEEDEEEDGDEDENFENEEDESKESEEYKEEEEEVEEVEEVEEEEEDDDDDNDNDNAKVSKYNKRKIKHACSKAKNSKGGGKTIRADRLSKRQLTRTLDAKTNKSEEGKRSEITESGKDKMKRFGKTDYEGKKIEREFESEGECDDSFLSNISSNDDKHNISKRKMAKDKETKRQHASDINEEIGIDSSFEEDDDRKEEDDDEYVDKKLKINKSKDSAKNSRRRKRK
ncbi:putative SNF2 superfamily family [Monocercomonoides exilis]|uniref:putative SNF2 superfamily family n=1 Tax=Monocercomonoides exilis TaxID=2049356 RepID=UPI00355A47D4|nr:putative SNF2 super family [Monocercomonoides exilis]|eukprot:MONOS_5479.1-p1 / transcript=MONOS_5479.1 / gene=MONOS_5479 / organism=Monocercomonoides_exilis_PA203 / gene_product=SNF2 super family / transcript_product=SNF2 super family / location=Mono_scaffold00160:12090-20615(+) / protein_length=2841 / sequence_SO=supercontig / SO=protein_coding / is_pseudo=false